MPRITFDITNVDDLHNQISAFFKTNAAIDQVGVPEALEVSEPVAQTPKKKAKKKAKKSKKAVPTKDDIQSSLQTVTETHSLSEARDILKAFSCERISDLEEEQYEDFIKACESIDE